ncbi:MAG: TAXI family TRAP transporter solute-binding subunit [Desulfobacteraceae bacterium]|nr:TAXI family TRAP transporter solute-binding subunit [Desulfobacteraceae bacterium]
MKKNRRKNRIITSGDGGFTRRDFIKTATTSLAAAGLLGSFPGLAFGAKEYTFGSASSAGSWYPLAVAMSKIISDNVPGYHVTGTTTPGASRENIMRMDRREMELAWSTANFLYKGYEGLDPFKSKQDVLGWFSAYTGIFTIVARADTGAKTMSDLKGLKIGTSTPGSMTQLGNDEVIFPAHGLIPGKDYQSEKIQFTDAVQKMIDGHIDACSYFMGAGVPGYNRMADSTKLNFIPIEDSAKPKIQEKEPSFYFCNLPAGTYRGQKEAVEYVCLAYTTCCGAYLDDEFMYKATKAVFENLDFITNASAVFKETTIDGVYDGMPVPVHPGAAKYYKERGVTP